MLALSAVTISGWSIPPAASVRCNITVWFQCMQSSAGVGANLPDAEAYASAGFEFGASRNGPLEGPRPLLRGGSLSIGFALPMQGPGTPSSSPPSLASQFFKHRCVSACYRLSSAEEHHLA